MAKQPDLDAPELFLNRELSWLEFNDRVLREGLSDDVPLLERLKFLAIVSSNLDEFFMVRVAGLKQQVAAGATARDPSGLTPAEQLERISRRAHQMAAEQGAGIRDAFARLADHGLHVLPAAAWTSEQRNFLRSYFTTEVLPVLTPLAVEELHPFPILPGLTFHVLLGLAASGNEPTTPPLPRGEGRGEGAAPLPLPRGEGRGEGAWGATGAGGSTLTRPPLAGDLSPRERCQKPEEPLKLAVVAIPPSLPRFVPVPAGDGLHLAMMEDVVAEHAGQLFTGFEVAARTVFRLTRDADVPVTDDDAADLLQLVEEAVRSRRRTGVVRLALVSHLHLAHSRHVRNEDVTPADPRLKEWLKDWCQVGDEDVYEVDGLLDAAALYEIVSRPGFEKLREPDWPPQTPRDLLGHDDLWQAIADHDVLLFHPYEAFQPVIRLVELAAEDPRVIAIKMTLYRVSANSPIVAALARASENGKQVTVLVELKARFDEARNVNWARRLEDAGCHVIYGIAGLKTHAKLLLIIRREEHGIRRYVHAGTGNYNDRTARLYSDMGLLTADRDFAADASAFFNLLTGYSQAVGWNAFAISPTESRARFIELIEREADASTPDQPGLIMAKMNSLQDKALIQALYRASIAGVRVLLNVRGICCLRPGIPGVSDNIEAVSIVDRYLEHARVFYFRNGGHEEVYLSSADWMVRNLDKRLEIIFPVAAEPLRRRLVAALETYFADNAKARRLGPDGAWAPVKRRGKPVRAQQKLYEECVEAARAADQAPLQFRPLARP
ncbi:MAG: polyphosphate kinase 1 [Planctomycetes bacterium]|nr:polyphosphate kinase 1 [Planctomycetota bacterium]